MSRRRQLLEGIREQIITDGKPLQIARLALDEFHHNASHEVRDRIKDGESLEALMGQHFEDDVEGYARDILGDEPTGSGANWLDWFGLKMTLEVAKNQRLFQPAAYSNAQFQTERARLQVDAYRGYGALLCDSQVAFQATKDIAEKRFSTGALAC